MFRIKTALLACLLLVAAISSVSALGQSQDPHLSSFGEFVAVNHQQYMTGTRLHAEMTGMTNDCIYLVKQYRLSEAGNIIAYIQRYLDLYGNLLIELAKSKRIKFDTNKLHVLLKEAASTLKIRNLNKTVSSLEQILSILKTLN